MSGSVAPASAGTQAASGALPAPPQAPGVAAFDYARWSTRYPELVAVTPQPLAEALFAEAGLYLSNTAASPVGDAAPGGRRDLLLGMLMAHLAYLRAFAAAQGVGGLVGRITSATEGSVSVGSDVPSLPGSAAWYGLSPYGLLYWQATRQYRTMRYVPGAGPAATGCYGARPWP